VKTSGTSAPNPRMPDALEPLDVPEMTVVICPKRRP
jgi:hypothetical protein